MGETYTCRGSVGDVVIGLDGAVVRRAVSVARHGEVCCSLVGGASGEEGSSIRDEMEKGIEFIFTLEESLFILGNVNGWPAAISTTSSGQGHQGTKGSKRHAGAGRGARDVRWRLLGCSLTVASFIEVTMPDQMPRANHVPGWSHLRYVPAVIPHHPTLDSFLFQLPNSCHLMMQSTRPIGCQARSIKITSNDFPAMD